ncbi:MAG: nuclear transport factor 2 family protein [Ignavibacteriales bacterium]|nr:nuclear transport factor 2 family protein [Ignavibacteriales bacterium]
MKLTEQQKSEVMPVYETWWKSYLNGDVKTYDYYLDDDYRFVGSTEAEAFLNRKDTTKFFEATADQLAGKSELRNSVLRGEYFDGLIFITELADAYLLSSDEWTFYGKFRFSSVLKKNEEGWRFIYQHFSTPDSKAQEGETIGLEKITTENQELRDAIKRRTIELENNNRELEIEAALERVRTVAMGMSKPDDLLNICEIVFKELKLLGFDKLRNALISTYEDGKDCLNDYDYSDSIGATSPKFHIEVIRH